MSNLLKRYSVVEKNERVIDYNDVISEKINEMRKNLESTGTGGFVEGLNPPIVEQLLDEDGNPVDMSDFTGDDQEAAGSGDGFVAGLNPKQVVDLDAVQAQADEILAQARAEADEILAQARAEAGQVTDAAREDGIQQGRAQAEQEAEELRQRLQQEFDTNRQQLEAQYDEMKAQLEPELVDVLMKVFTNAIQVIGEEDQEVILHLVNHVLHDSDMDSDFVVKVGPDDYKFLTQNQGKIYMSVNNDIQMEIVEDSGLEKNQCLIETATGVINCSLDIQLKSLVKDLKILSCMSAPQ